MPVKPTDKEDEHFARLEYEKLRKKAQAYRQELQEDEQEKLRELHHMHCPKCGMDLATVMLHRVEVDTCGACGGVWLDAGELEKLQKVGSSSLASLLTVFLKD
jgi:hypothetical protein